MSLCSSYSLSEVDAAVVFRAKRSVSNFYSIDCEDDGGSDVGILYSIKDGKKWADFIEKDLSKWLPMTFGRLCVRLRKMSIDVCKTYKNGTKLQAKSFAEAKLQIIIISPGLISFLRSEVNTMSLGMLLRKGCVIALMLKVTLKEVTDDSLLVSALHSFEEWTHLEVQNNDISFIRAIRLTSANMLKECESYDGFRSTNTFSLFPRTITQHHRKVYIHLKSAMEQRSALAIKLELADGNAEIIKHSNISFHNVYTISFFVPQKYTDQTQRNTVILIVSLFINGWCTGWRELECDGPLKILRTTLDSSCDPIGLMNQVIGLESIDGDLDTILASRLMKNPALIKMFSHDGKALENEAGSQLPTWLHFGAYYGLNHFCLALLSIPGAKKILRFNNSCGHTPESIAWKRGYVRLATYLHNCLADTVPNGRSHNYANVDISDDIISPKAGIHVDDAPIWPIPPGTSQFEQTRSGTPDNDNYGNFQKCYGEVHANDSTTALLPKVDNYMLPKEIPDDHVEYAANVKNTWLKSLLNSKHMI